MTRFAHFAGIGDGITNVNLGCSQRELNRQPDKMAHPVPKAHRSFRSAAPLAIGRWSVDAVQATSVENLPPGTPRQSGTAPESEAFGRHAYGDIDRFKTAIRGENCVRTGVSHGVVLR